MPIVTNDIMSMLRTLLARTLPPYKKARPGVMSNTSAALASTQAVSPLFIRTPCCPGRRGPPLSPSIGGGGPVWSGRHVRGAPVDRKRFRRGVSGVTVACYGDVTEAGVA